MRLATITNWAYGATLALTLASGVTGLLASNALQDERAAVARRHTLDEATSTLDEEVFALTNQARLYIVTGKAGHLQVYRRQEQAAANVEDRLNRVRDAGAKADELAALKTSLQSAQALREQQHAAIEAHRGGDGARASQILFGAEYERDLDRVRTAVERFQYRQDQRTANEVQAATRIARQWRVTSEVVLGLTGFLFLCVLYFLIKQRILRPVVRLSDVVTRLAAQDFEVEPPVYGRIDEIGDMAQAIRVFRENGLERQRLEAARDADLAMRELLSRMTQRMQGCDSLSGVTEVVERFMPQIAQGLAGRLYFLDDARNAMVEACKWGAPIHSREDFSPLSCWALRRGAPHRAGGEAVDVPCAHLDWTPDDRFQSICLPLTAQRETIGLIYLEARADAQTVLPPDAYIRMLAENVGLAVSNLRLRDALRAMAMADPLTGLANRRQLSATLDIVLAEAEREGAPISCLMVDVDHFKQFNDRYGHDAGDAVLRAVATALGGSVREENLTFRTGGEEFVVLLPGFSAEQAAARAEVVREKIAALKVVFEGVSLGPVTVSLGLATCPEHVSADRLLQAADAALLRAKRAGRNRVERARPRNERKAAG